MIELVRTTLAGQFEAALCMLHDLSRKCPPERWEGKSKPLFAEFA